MNRILSIDPGPKESAWMIYKENKPEVFGMLDNDKLLSICKHFSMLRAIGKDNVAETVPAVLAIEMVACYGMPVGRDVFDTCVWIGRFVEAWGGDFVYVYRRDVKILLCNSMQAKDSNVRQVLIDRYGGKDKAIGGVKCRKCKGKGWFGAGRAVCPVCQGDKWKYPPGLLSEITGDVWSALAIAVYQAERTE